MIYRRIFSIPLLLLSYGCACDFPGREIIVKTKTPYEKMAVEQEQERLKKVAKPIIISNNTQMNETNLEGYELGGESDKNTAGKIKSLFFDYKQSKLSQAQKNELQLTANEINKHPEINFILSGHSDRIGGDSFNKKISLKRVTNVYNQLIENGVDKSRLGIYVAGQNHPLVEFDIGPADDSIDKEYLKKHLAKNRRVNFIVSSINGEKIDFEKRIALLDEKQSSLEKSVPVSSTIQNPEHVTLKSVYFISKEARLLPAQKTILLENLKLLDHNPNDRMAVTIMIKGKNERSIKINSRLAFKRAEFIKAISGHHKRRIDVSYVTPDLANESHSQLIYNQVIFSLFKNNSRNLAEENNQTTPN